MVSSDPRKPRKLRHQTKPGHLPWLIWVPHTSKTQKQWIPASLPSPLGLESTFYSYHPGFQSENLLPCSRLPSIKPGSLNFTPNSLMAKESEDIKQSAPGQLGFLAPQKQGQSPTLLLKLVSESGVLEPSGRIWTLLCAA